MIIRLQSDVFHFFFFFSGGSWTPLTILAVVIGGISAVVIIILVAAFLLTRPCLRRLPIGEERKPLLSDPGNEVDANENTLPKSDDGRGYENLLNASQHSRNSSCNITQSKKDDFNNAKVVSGPI